MGPARHSGEEIVKRITIIVVLTYALVAGLGACGKKPLPNYDYSQEPDPRKREYILGVTDGLNINVWKNPELSAQATIRPDGTITMPLIGDLQAAGKTPTELKQEIRAKLAQYIKLEGVEITIAVTRVSSYNYTVSGEVAQPGVYSSERYVTVAEAIAQAGGASRFAETERIILMRRDAKTGDLRKIPISYDLIISGERPDMNLVLLPGDTILVP